MVPRWCCAVLVLSGCASAAPPGPLYSKGMKAFDGGDLAGAVKALEAFAGRRCERSATAKGNDPRCRRAYVTLAKAHDRLGAPGGAWAAYDAALDFPPHEDDATLEGERERARSELAERHEKAAEHAPVVISYKDEVSDEYNPRSVRITLDAAPVLTKDKDASDLRGDTFRRIFGGSVAAGEHVLMVEAVHDCKPGSGRCARSRVKKAFPFKSAPRTPTTIEIRTFTKEGEGDEPARPSIELVTR